MSNCPASARFFLRIGQIGRASTVRDDQTLPLFPLPLIMDAEGTLAADARHLVNDDVAYLKRCEKLIRGVSLELDPA